MHHEPRAEPKASGLAPDQPDTPFAAIGRDHAARGARDRGRMERLPARSGADVRDAVSRTRVEDAHDERGRVVLDGEPPFPEAGNGGGVPAVEQHAVGIDR